LGKVNSSIHFLHHSFDDIQLSFKPAITYFSVLIFWSRIGTRIVNGNGTYHIECGVKDAHGVVTEIVANTSIDINRIVLSGRIAEMALIGQLLIERYGVTHGKLTVVPLNENYQTLKVFIVNRLPDGSRCTTHAHDGIAIGWSTQKVRNREAISLTAGVRSPAKWIVTAHRRAAAKTVRI
jgi:hypothetical protein